jgi:6-phosphofructokinase 1
MTHVAHAWTCWLQFSIGSDTALNCIVDSIDRVKLSASSSRARVFLVEVMGGNCGFLAVLGALAGGADGCYIHENVVSLEEMLRDVHFFREKFSMNFKKGLIVRNECCSRLYNMPFMQSLFEQEGGRVGHMNFTVRNNVLGHLQQGNAPSPLDRCRATILGIATADDLVAKITANLIDGTLFTDAHETSVVCGVDGDGAIFTPISELAEAVDYEERRPHNQWWSSLEPLIRLLELNNEGPWGDALLYTSQARVLSVEEV